MRGGTKKPRPSNSGITPRSAGCSISCAPISTALHEKSRCFSPCPIGPTPVQNGGRLQGAAGAVHLGAFALPVVLLQPSGTIHLERSDALRAWGTRARPRHAGFGSARLRASGTRAVGGHFQGAVQSGG